MLCGHLAYRALPTSSISASALYRVIDAHAPTLLLDEAETYLRRQGRHDDTFRGVLDGGHTRETARVIRCMGDDHTPTVCSTWAPKLLALIGRPPSTIVDRAITVSMRRRLPHEVVERLRIDRIEPLAAPLRRQARRWANDVAPLLEGADPSIPDALHDRAADCWRPMFAIADVVGRDWPDQSRQASIALLTSCEEPVAGIELLGDLRRITEDDPADEPPIWRGADLVQQLVALEDRPWATWGRQERGLTQHALARLLAPYEVHPRSDGAGRGYRPAALRAAYERYLPRDSGRLLHTKPSECQNASNDAAEPAESKCQSIGGVDSLQTVKTPASIGSIDTLTLRSTEEAYRDAYRS